MDFYLHTIYEIFTSFFQFKGKKGKGKSESMVDGAVADTEVFTEELRVSISTRIMKAIFLFKLLPS